MPRKRILQTERMTIKYSRKEETNARTYTVRLHVIRDVFVFERI